MNLNKLKIIPFLFIIIMMILYSFFIFSSKTKTSNIFFEWTLFQKIIFYLPILTFQQMFLSQIILVGRAYNHRIDLIMKKVINEDQGTDTLNFYMYFSFTIFPLIFAGTILYDYFILGILNICLLSIFSFFLFKIPLTEIKEIYFVYRGVLIKFKKFVYNILLSPQWYMIYTIVLLGITGLYLSIK